MTAAGAIGLYELARDKIENVQLKDTQLLIGYEKNWFRWPVIIDMEVTPHLFASGLSGNGKSRMVEYAVRDKSVILLNTVKKDFQTIKARRINGNDKILGFLNNLIKNIYYREIPLYIVIDELLVLCIDNRIEKAIMQLLAIGRHYNIYLIGISQSGTKESCRFKDLFNCRVSFRQVEESAYRAVLGYSPEIRDLQKRQFLYYSTDVGMGYTYDVGA